MTKTNTDPEPNLVWSLIPFTLRIYWTEHWLFHIDLLLISQMLKMQFLVFIFAETSIQGQKVNYQEMRKVCHCTTTSQTKNRIFFYIVNWF